MRYLPATFEEVLLASLLQPFKEEWKTVLFKDPVRTAL
jgi:hypothetical protein